PGAGEFDPVVGAGVPDDSGGGALGADVHRGRKHPRPRVGPAQYLHVLEAVEQRDHQGVLHRLGGDPFQGRLQVRRLGGDQQQVDPVRQFGGGPDPGGEVAVGRGGALNAVLADARGGGAGGHRGHAPAAPREQGGGQPADPAGTEYSEFLQNF